MATRRTAIIISATLLVVLLRHVVLTFFVHPYGDDFSYAAVGMRTDLLERLASEYRFWNGRYFTNILVLRGPITLGWETGLALYRVIPVLLMGLTWWASYAFIKEVFEKRLSRSEAGVGALLFMLVLLNAMPDASEGFYWYTGSVTYQLPNVLTLFLGVLWIRYWRGGSMGGGQRIGIALLVVVVAGCNELHMAFMVLGHAALLCVHRIRRHRWDRLLVLMLVLSAVCMMIVFLAPGNAVRGAHFPLKHRFFATIGNSFLQTGRFTLVWVFTTALLPISLMYLGWLRRRFPDRAALPAWCAMDRWVALLVPFALVFISMVLPYWSSGILGQYRTVNVALFVFLPAWFLALSVWDAQVFRAWELLFPRLSDGIVRWIPLVLALVFCAWGRDGRVTSDLFSGRAERYDGAVMQRFAAIRQAIAQREDRIVLPEIMDRPTSLSILQPTGFPGNWLNKSMGQYFGNEELRIIIAPASDPRSGQ